MDKPAKMHKDASEEKSLEMLETAIEEIDTLTRAFELINEVCREVEEEAISFEGCSNRFLLN